MLKNVNYNQLKLFRFIASIVVLCVYIGSFLAEQIIPALLMELLFVVSLLVFIVSIVSFAVAQRRNKKVMQDELTIFHEKKATEFTFGVLAFSIFAGIIYTQLTDSDVVLRYEVLVCMLVAIFAVSDGYYLFLERKGGNDADVDYED